MRETIKEVGKKKNTLSEVRDNFDYYYGDDSSLILLGVYKLDKHSLYNCPIYKEEREEYKECKKYSVF